MDRRPPDPVHPHQQSDILLDYNRREGYEVTSFPPTMVCSARFCPPPRAEFALVFRVVGIRKKIPVHADAASNACDWDMVNW